MRIGINLSIASSKGGSGAPPAATTSSISPTSMARYTDEQILTINGANFTVASVATADGVPLATTYVNATRVTAIIPSSLEAGSPLRTTGSKSIAVDGSNAQSLTVTAWAHTSPASFRESYVGENYVAGTWTGTSALANLTQATGANRPTPVASLAALGNRAVVQYDGVNDSLASSAAMSAYFSAANFVAQVVCVVDSVPTTGANISVAAPAWADADGYMGLHFDSVGPEASFYHYSGAVNKASTALTTGVGIVLTARRTGGQIELYKGPYLVDSVASGDSALAAVLRSGVDWTNTKFFAGKIGRLSFYNTELSSTELSQVLNEAMVEYGLA